MNEYPQALWVCVIVGDFAGLWVVARCCFKLCHQTVARLPLAGATLLRGRLRAWPDLSVPAAAAGLLLVSGGVLSWLLRLGCLRWCISGTYCCALAGLVRLGALFLQGHQVRRAPNPFFAGGWSYKAYCVFRPCPAKPAAVGSAGHEARCRSCAATSSSAARSASAGCSC